MMTKLLLLDFSPIIYSNKLLSFSLISSSSVINPKSPCSSFTHLWTMISNGNWDWKCWVPHAAWINLREIEFLPPIFFLSFSRFSLSLSFFSFLFCWLFSFCLEYYFSQSIDFLRALFFFQKYTCPDFCFPNYIVRRFRILKSGMLFFLNFLILAFPIRKIKCKWT